MKRLLAHRERSKFGAEDLVRTVEAIIHKVQNTTNKMSSPDFGTIKDVLSKIIHSSMFSSVNY